jgi:tRNA1Val (adenine37-N6)-methyltransferase
MDNQQAPASLQGFQFKQFRVEHAHCAMKVGTDSILLGSWIDASAAKHILDIGTGSGLLAIMLAQKSGPNTVITGIDIEQQAIFQAQENAKSCPWSKKLCFHHKPLQELPLDQYFDLMVCNPPYFPINISANQQQPKTARIHARQTLELTHLELLTKVSANLSQDGQFYCVLPLQPAAAFIKQAEKLGLNCISRLEVKGIAGGKIIRQLMAFSRNRQPQQVDTLCIYKQQGRYSEQFKELCGAYYLNF